MQWIFLILTAAGCFAAAVSYLLLGKSERYKFMGLFWASVFFILVNCALFFEPMIPGNMGPYIVLRIAEWGHLLCVALVLSSLLLFVRESKPEFSQFPLLYVTFPFLIVISYLLIMNTVVLKDWLMNIYQGGAAMVAVLMYGIYSYNESIYRIPFTGSVLLFIAFFSYLLLPESYKLFWQIALVMGIVTTFGGLLLVERNIEQQLR